MKRLFIFCSILLCIAIVAQSEIRHVPDDYETIQDGIGAADEGDTVLVEPGEYVENIRLGDNSIILASFMLLTGDENYIDSTIINGDDQDRVIMVPQTEQLNPGGTIQGFTITGGTGSFGGGICCYHREIVLKDLIVKQNSATFFGGGISVSGPPSIFKRVRVFDNEVTGENGHGGGIGLNPGTLYLDSCQITGNVAQIAGGCSFFGVVTASNVIVSDNEATSSIGGIYIWNGVQELTYQFSNITVTNNFANDELASGIYCATSENNDLNVVIHNSIIFGNSGNDIMLGGRLDNQQSENISSMLLSYCNIGGGIERIHVFNNGELSVGDGNIDADPLFADPDNGDYRLTADSPCIDSGDPDSPLDPDGTRADMGAFYFHQREISVNFQELSFDTLYATQETQELTFTVHNIGLQVLNVDSIAVIGEYYFVDSSNGFNLEPDEEKVISVFFAPEDSGYFAGMVTINSNAVNGVAVLSLTGYARWWLNSASSDKLPPTDFMINGAYPNPFNNSTTITYRVGANSNATILSIFDLSGRLVENLVNSNIPAGKHTVVWDASGVGAGVYFVRMEADPPQPPLTKGGVDSRMIRKLVVIK